MTLRHLLEIDDLSVDELRAVLDLGRVAAPPQVLAGKGAALLFEKQSARTRNSTEMAVVQLGGHPVTIRPDEVDLDVRESVEDVTRTLASYHSLLAARVYAHSKLERMVAVSPIPVVNLLCDDGHPVQALADILTIEDELGDVRGRSVAYVGDSNNVTRSLALAAGSLGMHVRVASPAGYGFSDADEARIRTRCPDLELLDDPAAAVRDVDVVYADTWVSMGQEAEHQARLDAFAGYQIDDALMSHAAPGAIFLHCLPAHRGVEVTDAVLDGPHSRIWPQAANRMHSIRGLFVWLMQQAADGGAAAGVAG